MLVDWINDGDKADIGELADRLVLEYPECRSDKRRAENPGGTIVHALWLRKRDQKVIDAYQQQTIQSLSIAEAQRGAA